MFFETINNKVIVNPVNFVQVGRPCNTSLFLVFICLPLKRKKKEKGIILFHHFMGLARRVHFVLYKVGDNDSKWRDDVRLLQGIVPRRSSFIYCALHVFGPTSVRTGRSFWVRRKGRIVTLCRRGSWGVSKQPPKLSQRLKKKNQLRYKFFCGGVVTPVRLISGN